MKILSHSQHLLTLAALSLTLSACGGSSSPDAAVPQSSATTTSATTTAPSIAQRPDRVPLVVGGSVVEHSRYPWMTALVNANEPDASQAQFCGGSLIAANWVLTAAHCVEDMQAADTAVLLGQRDLSVGNGERINVQRLIVHPDYASQGYPDIALLQLAEDSSAPVITLPSQNNLAPNDGEMATVTGWGQVSENGPYSDDLRETTMAVVAHDTCNRAYDNELNREAMVCAGSPSGDRDSCYGDSGGPLFVKRNSEYVQAGIVSFGEACGLAGVPGVYARVSSYYDWISAYAPVTAYDATGNSVPPVVDNTSEADSGEIDSDDNGSGNGLNNGFDNNSDNSSDENAETAWQFSGQVDGWYDEAYLPESGDFIEMTAGLLTIDMQTQADEPLVLFVDEYDAEYDEWYPVTGAITNNGSLVLDIDISDGLYAFSVVALGQGGSFSLNANLNE